MMMMMMMMMIHSFLLLCLFVDASFSFWFSHAEYAMRATAPVTTIVPATAIAELYGTYRSQFNTRKKDVSGTTTALLSLLIQLFLSS